jgi:hypothetical protein
MRERKGKLGYSCKGQIVVLLSQLTFEQLENQKRGYMAVTGQYRRGYL